MKAKIAKLIGIDPTDPSSGRRTRDIYRKLRNSLYPPKWVERPSNIQIDTQNFCNLWQQGKGCIHCNVKPSGGWGIKRGRMPDEMIEYIIRYWGAFGVESIAPYVNGEPLLDDRIPWICDLAQKKNMHVELDTNGTLFDKRKMLVHPALKQVRFSYSAVTSDVYKTVHGAALFRDVTNTIHWFLKNRLPEQYPMLYFITNKFNIDELLPYIKRWKGKAHLVLFPIHEVGEIQQKSLITRPTGDYWGQVTEKITGKCPTQKMRPIDIYPNGFTTPRYFNGYEVCQGTHSFSVSCHGDLLHCTDIPYSFNYGHIYDNDMLTVWHKRNLAKIGHPACLACNVRCENHDELLRRFLKV